MPKNTEEIYSQKKKSCNGLKKIIKRTSLVIGAYIGLIFSAQAVSMYIYPGIYNQSQFEIKLEEGKRRLGIGDDITIKWAFREGGYHRDESFIEKVARNTIDSTKLGKKEYKIRFTGGASESLLRHELFHIADGHFEHLEGMSSLVKAINYAIVYEPRATAYQLLGRRVWPIL